MTHSSPLDSPIVPPSFQPRSQRSIVLLVLIIMAAGAIALSSFGWRQSVLFGIGGLFGISLYHASFGFASAYRKLLVWGDVRAIQAQVLMLTVTTLLFAPVLLSGSVFGQPVAGAVAPVAVQGAIGAFLFGIGMQLGSGCACGTLYTIGGGSSLMVLTLLTFSGGAFWATLTGDLWTDLPKTQPLSLIGLWGWGGVLLQILVLLSIGYGLRQWQHRAVKPNPRFSASMWSALRWRTLLYGPWSLTFGALVLALLNQLTLLIAGRPWGVTWGFTLWAAKIAQLLGWDPSTSSYWSQATAADALSRSVFADVISVMNFGIVLGATLAAALAGKLTLKKPASRSAIVAALIGGLMMGYGARLAFGCNVGAYFSGIASTSLHGWLWIIFALLGTALGIRARAWFKLER